MKQLPLADGIVHFDSVDASLASQKIDTYIVGDPVEPGRKLGVAAVCLKRLKSADKRLLAQVLGILVIACQIEQKIKNEIRVFRDQVIERCARSLSGFADPCLVLSADSIAF